MTGEVSKLNAYGVLLNKSAKVSKANAYAVLVPATHGDGKMDWTSSWVGLSATLVKGAGAMNLTSSWAASVSSRGAGAMDWHWSAALPAFSTSLTDGFTVHGSLSPAWGTGATLTQAMRVSLAQGLRQNFGPTMRERVSISRSGAAIARFNVTLKQAQIFADLISSGLPTAIAEFLTVHQEHIVSFAVSVLTRLRVGSALSTTSTFGVILAQAIRITPALEAFFGGGLTDGIVISSALPITYIAASEADDGITIQSMFSFNLLFNLTTEEEFNITDAELLQMIFAGEIDDGIDLSALYVSPSGTITTWAINTRTNAITEYQNWAFNSFARMGNKYIAADENGLYELDGERDLGSNISAIMRNGMMQMNASRLSGLKGLYLGMRTDTGGDFYLKLIAGDGREYTYAFAANPNTMTTKVEIGRGLRSRYFAFELESTGSDFDLDGIEFVPMMPSRRV